MIAKFLHREQLPPIWILARLTDFRFGVTRPDLEAAIGQTVLNKAAQKRQLPQVRKKALIVSAITQLSGKTKDDIIAMKKAGKTMPQIITDLGLTKEQVQNSVKETISKRKALHDQNIAQAISRITGKTSEEIQAMKSGKRWPEIVKDLGLTKAEIKKEIGVINKENTMTN
ncbi:MAG: hypothetical protein ACYCX4_14625 [Bacillota bacterium]